VPPRPEATTVAGLPSGATDGTGTSDIGNGTGPAGAQPAPLVIDTNIVLDLLVFDDPCWAALRTALAAGQLRWIATPPMRAELARVLGYPLIARRLDRDARAPEAVLAAFDARSHVVEPMPPRAPFVCKDTDDQIFIDLAVCQRAVLLSKDRAVLAMRRRLATLGVVVTPAFA
jgi:putative PIN family toxin of toxin-antitoxin system